MEFLKEAQDIGDDLEEGDDDDDFKDFVDEDMVEDAASLSTLRPALYACQVANSAREPHYA